MFLDIESFRTWDEINATLDSRFCDRRWAFRGQSNASWGLTPSLERSILRHRIGKSSGKTFESYISSHPNAFEQPLLSKFQQRMKKYAFLAPPDNENVEWLALMQHYGAPTRLFDWTSSAYVALYFALRDRKMTEDHAVWAIDTAWVNERSRLRLKAHDCRFSEACCAVSLQNYLNDTLFNALNPSVVVLGNPVGVNERRAAQQGLFLFDLGSTMGTTFDITLMTTFYEVPADPPVCKLIIAPEDVDLLISELARMGHR